MHGLLTTYLVTVRVRATVEHALHLAPIARAIALIVHRLVEIGLLLRFQGCPRRCPRLRGRGMEKSCGAKATFPDALRSPAVPRAAQLGRLRLVRVLGLFQLELQRLDLVVVVVLGRRLDRSLI